MDDPHLDPASGVLRNRLGITDAVDLARAEAHIAASRELQLLVERPNLGRYDLAHLQAIHRHLFAEVYDWAGEIRTVDIAKGSTNFAPYQHIRAFADTVFDGLRADHYLRNVDDAQFAAKAGTLLSDLNALHPFREGNGRTQRSFLNLLANDAGRGLHWADVDPKENLRASITATTDENHLQAIVARITVPLEGVQTHRQVLPRFPGPTMTSTPRPDLGR